MDFLISFSRIKDYFDVNYINRLLNRHARDYLKTIIRNRDIGVVNVGVHVRRGDMVNVGGIGRFLQANISLRL